MSIIQQRLKLPGAWWTPDNVDSMLVLRIIRANNTCYSADEQGRVCVMCDACRLRKAGFTDAGIDDLTRYQK